MKKYILKHCNILNGKEDMSPQLDMDILIEGNKIVKICKDISTKAKEIDCRNKYVIPGLINLHVHLPGSGKPSNKKVADKGKLIRFLKSNRLTSEIGIAICRKHAKQSLLSGITTVRAVGGVGNFDTILRDRIAKGKVKGCRIISCGEAIGVKGGHMDGTVAVAAANIEEGIKLVEQRKKEKCDWIKLMITGGVLDCKVVGHPGDLKMPPEMVKALCDKAHELGMKVCAHVESPEGVEVAVKNGVDTLEHGSNVSEELVKEFSSRDGALVVTLSPALPFVYLNIEDHGYDEAARINSKVLADHMVAMAENCLKNNVKVGLGSDVGCPFTTNTNFGYELLYASKLIKGMTPSIALHLATEVNASIIGMDKEIGTVEEDKIADLAIFDSNPLDNLELITKPSMVVGNGKLYKKTFKQDEFIEIRIKRIINKL